MAQGGKREIMKKFLCLLLISILALSACSSGGKKSSSMLGRLRKVIDELNQKIREQEKAIASLSDNVNVEAQKDNKILKSRLNKAKNEIIALNKKITRLTEELKNAKDTQGKTIIRKLKKISPPSIW